MEFVSSETGQSLQLLSMDEFRRERGGIFLPDVGHDISVRYRFQSFPERFVPNQAIKFEYGVQEIDGITISINSLDIYSDGVSITTHNTDDADIILEGFLDWVINTYGLKQPRTLTPRRYQSRIVVDLSASAGQSLIKGFQDVSRIIANRLGAGEQLLEVTQLSIGPNPPAQYPFLHTWILQPRITQPHVHNRYYSSAPLSTKEHFDMLQEIETALAKG